MHNLPQPLYSRMLVKVDPLDETKESGLYLDPNLTQQLLKEKNAGHSTGLVLSTGEGYQKEDGTIIPLRVKPGDRVIFPCINGVKYKQNDEEYLLLKENEVWGILPNPIDK